MDRYRLLLHPLCPTSRSLVLGLHRAGLLGGLELILLDKPRPLGRVFPWSVPLLVSPEGDPLAMDPLDVESVRAILEGRTPPVRGDREQFAVSVLYSAYASSIALAHHGLKPLLEPSFLLPALRLRALGRTVEEAVESLAGVLDGIYKEERERIARALSIAVVRHLWYSGAGLEDLENIGEAEVGAIVLSMASVGRAFLPGLPRRPDMTGFIASFIRRRARGLLAKVEREHREITGDREYQRILGVSLKT